MSWAAEGFIKPRKSRTMEDTAKECIEELAERSLFLVKKKTYSGKIKTFCIHDVLREVSMKKAKEEKYLQQNRTSTAENITNDWYNVSSLKNDLNFHSDTYNAHLRSLKCTASSVSALLSVLCQTTSLRYFHVNISDEHITFPKSISELQNLETFILRTKYGQGSIIPLDFWKLRRLRHIVLESTCDLQFPVASERGYPILQSLQTLIGLTNVNLSMDVIERIPNVKRMKLIYDYTCEKEKNQLQSFSLSNIHHLHNLEELSIVCEIGFLFEPENHSTECEFGYLFELELSDLSFPRNLKKLTLYDIKTPCMSIIGSLPRLEVLKLKGWCITDDIWEPVEGEFLELKYLKMNVVDIKEWRVESFHFPCLQKLKIISCGDLKEVPECVGEIETLEELVLNDCPQLEESVQKIQESQQAFGNDLLKIIIIDCDL